MAQAHEAVAGQEMGAFAMTEPEAGSDAHGIACLARRDGDAYVLNGVKTLISNGGLADFYVVFAAVERGNPKSITAFLVDSHAAGLEFVRPLGMSAPHPQGEIAFHDSRGAEPAPTGECLTSPSGTVVYRVETSSYASTRNLRVEVFDGGLPEPALSLGDDGGVPAALRVERGTAGRLDEAQPPRLAAALA